jgi:hypothetical protein
MVNEVAWIPIAQLNSLIDIKSYVRNYTLTPNGAPSLDTWGEVYIAKH